MLIQHKGNTDESFWYIIIALVRCTRKPRAFGSCWQI